MPSHMYMDMSPGESAIDSELGVHGQQVEQSTMYLRIDPVKPLPRHYSLNWTAFVWHTVAARLDKVVG